LRPGQKTNPCFPRSLFGQQFSHLPTSILLTSFRARGIPSSPQQRLFRNQ
jgi:hypothetical protein